jgi:hypothetical protein
MKVELRKCCEALLAALPADLVAQLEWHAGDICECEIVDGGIKVVRTETAHDRTMKIARDVMDEYHDAFVALAKT